jgi:hypothetical protein
MKLLKEIGDLNKIQPYTNLLVSEDEFYYKIIDKENKLAIDIVFQKLDKKQVSNVRSELLVKGLKLQPTILCVNLGFVVNEKETQARRTNLLIYYKILKTVVEITKHFIESKHPSAILIGSKKMDRRK